MKIITALFASMILTATLTYGSGDLIVDGNLGVGTVNSRTRITLLGGNSEYDGNGDIFIDSNYNNLKIGVDNVNNASFFQAQKWSVGYMPLLLNPNGGNVGIGTGVPATLLQLGSQGAGNNTQKLSIPGVYNFENVYLGQYSNGNNGLEFINHTGLSSSYGIRLETNIDSGVVGLQIQVAPSASSYNTLSYSTAMAILANGGNVGIGTLAPTQKLDVAGTVASNGVALTSDAKFKKNLLPVTTPLDKILGLNGHSYEWKTDAYQEKNFPAGRHYGVIAQEVEKVLPEVVNTDAKGEKSVAYTEIIPVLIEAIKEQQKQIEELKQKLSQSGR